MQVEKNASSSALSVAGTAASQATPQRAASSSTRSSPLVSLPNRAAVAEVDVSARTSKLWAVSMHDLCAGLHPSLMDRVNELKTLGQKLTTHGGKGVGTSIALLTNDMEKSYSTWESCATAQPLSEKLPLHINALDGINNDVIKQAPKVDKKNVPVWAEANQELLRIKRDLEDRAEDLGFQIVNKALNEVPLSQRLSLLGKERLQREEEYESGSAQSR